jgi:hypothetical protein
MIGTRENEVYAQRALRGRVRRAGVSVLAAATLATAGCGGQQPAPRTAALPLPPGVRVIASAPGGSAIDTAHDNKQYRYMAISGPSGMSGPRLLDDVVRFLVRSGWRHSASSLTRNDGTDVTRGVVPSTPGALVLIDSPDGKVYAGLNAVAGISEVGSETGGTPLGDGVITRAIRQHCPVAMVTLGNGTHGPD